MEPLTAGAIALATLLVNKTFEKTGEIIVTKAFEQGNQVMNLIKHKSPEQATAIEAVAEKVAFPSREDCREAILVGMVELAAKEDSEIKAALTGLAAKVEEAQERNDNLNKAVNDLIKAVKYQRHQNPAKIADTIGKIGVFNQGSTIGTITVHL
ncbi:hypothetical protein [Limnofasciculus baicalensis]|uniref:Uncharacterized protein n=1 Tax=Limnofasciculus baicalensis BBK-W-15 TaxID=2699891 RepID=A0AAE3GPB7_9CYAN|nr:hypothetical protein [Limnofasciculus baicalensis]MCP2728245.1 hypothetical protein [Limnofasciculus baicalensis BBK-W-15]